MKPTPKQLQQFFEVQASKLNRCLEPALSCDKKTIRAHSIQNARVLDLLVEDGHVITPQQKMGKSGPKIVFEKVGRNNASTFTGLCAEHDASLFQVLDKLPFDQGNPEQLFQLAYRSITRELYVIMEGAARIQAAYCGKVERGEIPGDVPTDEGLMATQFLMNAYEVYLYRLTYFDPLFALRDFGAVQHDVFRFRGQNPTVAVSSLFSLRGLLRNDDLVRCILNVMPVSDEETVVVFSYGNADAPMARTALNRIHSANGDYQKYEISKLIVDRVENFVLSPRSFAAWNVEKRKIMHDAFVSTILGEKETADHKELMLF